MSIIAYFYRSHHYTEDLAMRQESMQQNYLFTCQCDACLLDFGKFRDLKSCAIEMISENDRVQLEAANKQYAIDNFERFAKYLAEYDHLYPCYELNAVQHHFRESLHIMAGNFSMKLTL